MPENLTSSTELECDGLLVARTKAHRTGGSATDAGRMSDPKVMQSPVAPAKALTSGSHSS